MRWTFEERRWLKPALTAQEQRWINYQLFRQLGKSKVVVRGCQIGLTGYLRPHLIHIKRSGDELDDIIAEEFQSKELVVNAEYDDQVLEILYEFTLPMFSKPGKQYGWTINQISEHFDDLSSLPKSEMVKTVLLLYLASALEYYAFTPMPLNSAALHKALACVGNVTMGMDMQVRMCPALTALYFKAVGCGKLLVAVRCVHVLMGCECEYTNPMIEALRKRAQVDGCLLNNMQPIVIPESVDRSKEQRFNFSKVEKHLKESREKDVKDVTKMDLLNVYPFWKLPREMRISGDGQWLVGKDMTDVVYAVKTRDLMQGLDRATFLRISSAEHFVLPRWSNTLIVIQSSSGKVKSRPLEGMMSDEEVLGANGEDTLISNHEFGVIKGLEYVYIGGSGDQDYLGECGVLIVLQHDRISFFHEHGGHYSLGLETCIIGYTRLEDYIVVSTGEELVYINILSGLIHRTIPERNVHLLCSYKRVLYCCTENELIVIIGEEVRRRRMKLDDAVTCAQAFPSGVLLGTLSGMVLYYNNETIVVVSDALHERSDAVVALTWLWYPEERLIVHGLNDLYIFTGK